MLFQNFDQFDRGDNWQTRHPLDGDFEGGDEGGFRRNGNLAWVGRLEEELNGFKEILFGFFHAMSLACDIKFGASGDIPIPFSFNDRRKHVSHGFVLQCEYSRSVENPMRINNAADAI